MYSYVLYFNFVVNSFVQVFLVS